jgi:hypothetical protein
MFDRKEYTKKYYLKNCDKIKERSRKWYSEKGKEWYLKNKDKILQQQKKYSSRPERKKYRKKFHLEHKDEENKWQRDYRLKLRMTVFSLMGNKCARCGFSDNRALQVDHVNGGGTKERKNFNCSESYWIHILDTFDTSKYQLLCANCNLIKKYENKEFPNRIITDS